MSSQLSAQAITARTVINYRNINWVLDIPGWPQYCSLCLDWIVGCRSGDAGLAAMAGVPAGLPAGIRLSDHISLGVIARAVPPERVRQVLAETGKASERERDLPAQVMVYYAIALALY